MKKNIKQHFATTYRRLTKKIMAFVYRSTFLVHFIMPAPSSWLAHTNPTPPNFIYICP